MEDNVLQFDNGIKRYRELAERRAEEDDLVGALGYLFTALKIENNLAVLMDIADIYADMSLYELSNQYWFYYLEIAPKDKRAVAYGELAVNYYYMGNVMTAGFYLHDKIKIERVIRQDGLDAEILENFALIPHRRKHYRVVYPYERSDNSFIMETAKKAVVAGEYEKAADLYSRVPDGAPEYYDAISELSVVKFLEEDVNEAIKLCQKLVKEKGESVSICCNLSSMYAYKRDKEKSRYYFLRALELKPETEEDNYKIASCALENEEHQTGIKYLDILLKDRPYDVTMRFFSGIARLNTGDYDGAEREFSTVIKIDPFNHCYNYYYRLAEKLKDGANAGRLIPLKYVYLLPRSEETARIKRIRALYEEDFAKIRSEIKKESVADLLDWGLVDGDNQTAKLCAFVLAKADCKIADEILSAALMNVSVEADVKRVIIYVLVAKGSKKRYNLIANDFLSSFKASRLSCEKSVNGGLYFCAYATCISRMVFIDGDCLSALAKSTDEVFSKIGDSLDVSSVSKDEIAALILSVTKTEKRFTEKNICEIFNVSKNKYKTLKEYYDGSKD